MKCTLLSLALLAAGLVGTANLAFAAPAAAATSRSASASVPDPAIQIKQMADLFRSGDVAALVQAAVPPSKWAMIQLAYEKHRLEPTSAHDRLEFAEKVARFTSPTAVDDLMAEIEPKLEEVRPQAPGALLMAMGAMEFAVASPESDLTEEQRASLRAALPGIQRWATTTDFLSTATMRTALTLLTEAARRTGVNDLDQLKAMPLEGVLDRAGNLLAAAKGAVKLYGIDLDAVADSLQVEVLDVDGTKARVRTTITVFNAPVWSEHDLVLVEGRWYGKDAIAEMHHMHIDFDGDHDDEETEG